ncbi:MAG: tRNA (N6-isopentenyl adenosine(37)-C2)-methylthiotransferase MiaB [Candidatus Glassbacteria bacterium]|nr:tRNA (N6-isopentenyl adenosine(37)-C2)-methylthiotransferase MiaB [Candidatus Glassbacteria bacterium]
MRRPETFYIETYGCQMNFSDSELVEAMLSAGGLRPAGSLEEAELVLVNTCGVREHAEQRVFGRLGTLKALKEASEFMLLGVIGCMAQRIGEKILSDAPWVDLVAGPDSYRALPEMLDELAGGNAVQLARLELDGAETYQDLQPRRADPVSAWVPVTRGCDNFCSYCIVPFVRGRERSVDAETVETWVRREVNHGAREIVLLGQNVNSYCDGETDFAALLRRLDKIDGLEWLRFLTCHPRDMSDRIIEAIAECSTVCEHLHLPVQSGSDPVLDKMNRGYTRDYYLERVEAIRRAVPGISLTTDILVGFPGETDEDFRRTVSLMEAVKFDYAFTFRYSPRPGTRAGSWEDSVPEADKAARLEEVIDLQLEHTRQALDAMAGRVVDAIPVKVAKTGEGKMQARTRTHFNLFLKAAEDEIGHILPARITGNTGMNLVGERVER